MCPADCAEAEGIPAEGLHLRAEARGRPKEGRPRLGGVPGCGLRAASCPSLQPPVWPSPPELASALRRTEELYPVLFVSA